MRGRKATADCTKKFRPVGLPLLEGLNGSVGGESISAYVKIVEVAVAEVAVAVVNCLSDSGGSSMLWPC